MTEVRKVRVDVMEMSRVCEQNVTPLVPVGPAPSHAPDLPWQQGGRESEVTQAVRRTTEAYESETRS